MFKIPLNFKIDKGSTMKKIPQGVLFITSGVIFLIGAVILSWWINSSNSWKLKEQLQIISPLFLSDYSCYRYQSQNIQKAF